MLRHPHPRRLAWPEFIGLKFSVEATSRKFAALHNRGMDYEYEVVKYLLGDVMEEYGADLSNRPAIGWEPVLCAMNTTSMIVTYRRRKGFPDRVGAYPTHTE